MMLKTFVPVALFISLNTFAQQDLSLPGERWIAKFNGYVCQAFGPKVTATQSHQAFQMKFEQITTDQTLDNGLIKASFVEQGSSCRYSAIMLADNHSSTIKLVESRAYSLDGASDCAEGKALLDAQLAQNDYLYYGHPHNLAVVVPDVTAEQVCGAGATHIGINFVVAGRINQ